MKDEKKPEDCFDRIKEGLDKANKPYISLMDYDDGGVGGVHYRYAASGTLAQLLELLMHAISTICEKHTPAQKAAILQLVRSALDEIEKEPCRDSSSATGLEAASSALQEMLEKMKNE